MAAGRGTGKRKSRRDARATASAGYASSPTKIVAKPRGRRAGIPLPSPVAGTNLVIADIVLRAAGGLLRDRMEKGLLSARYDTARAQQLVDGRSIMTSLALWGAGHLARRSPLGLAVVAGALAAKVMYDRGKRIEAARRSPASAKRPQG
jgi:hypothetical protein